MTTESRGTLSLARVLARAGDWVCSAGRIDDGTANKAGSFLGTFGPLTDASRRVTREEATRGGIICGFVRTIQCRFAFLPRTANFAQSARFSRSDMANLPIACNLP